jgi:hypothetical protein
MPYTKSTPKYISYNVRDWSTITTSDGTTDGPSHENGQLNLLADIKQGERRVGWRQNLKLGQDATTYFLRDTYKIEELSPGLYVHARECYPDIPPLHAVEINFGNGFPYCQNLVPTSHEALDLSEVDSEALTLLYKKIRNESSHMNGLQFFGELREALHMIRRPAESIWKGLEKYNTLLSKRKKGIRRKLPLARKLNIWKDIVAGTWLEVSFGWKPFVKDTQDIAETIARYTLPDSHRTRVRAYKEGLLGSSASGFVTAYGSSTVLKAAVDFRTKTTGGVQYICGLRTDGNGPVNSLDRLRNLSGLTLENFVPTIWELLPYSFLVDYFVNVGDILNSAFTSTTGVTWKMKTNRLVTERTVVQDPAADASLSPWVTIGAGGKPSTSRIVKSTIERIPIAGNLGIPDAVFTLPGKTTKYLNISALIAGARPIRFRF